MFPFALMPPAVRPPAPRSSEHVAPSRVERVNRALDLAWSKGWASPPDLDPAALIRKVEAKTGLAADPDHNGWRERLDTLCADLHQTARLTSLGRTIAHGQLVAALGNRFRAHALWQRHPAIADQPITAPVIIVGQMRSGTTRIQRLLACDPRLTFTRFYESWNPIPSSAGRPLIDRRKLKGRMGLLCARLLNPQFDTIHPTHWNAPDEEIGLHGLSIFGAAFEAQWRVPNYTAAIENGTWVAVYREFKQLLQTLAWLRGDDGRHPWILKVPQFSQDLADLLTVFPDARLICLSRDPAEVAASSASLVHNQMRLQSDAVDAQWIGAEWARKIALRDRRVRAARATFDGPHIDLTYDDVSADWETQMLAVYRMIDLPLPASVKQRMHAYLHVSRRTPGRQHEYDPAHFGLPVAEAEPLAASCAMAS